MISETETPLEDLFVRARYLALALDSSEVHMILGASWFTVCVGPVQGNGSSVRAALINAIHNARGVVSKRLDDANAHVRMLVETLQREEAS